MDYLSAKNNLAEIKKDMKSHPIMTLVVFLVVILAIMGLAAVTTYVSNWVSGKTTPTITQVINPQPPFKLAYTKLKEIKQETGLFQTTFEISVTRPSGNFQEGFNVLNGDNLGRANCSKPKETRTEAEESNGRQIYERGWYSVDCVSELPIVDNGSLFTIK